MDMTWTWWIDWKSVLSGRLNTGQTLTPKIFSALQNSVNLRTFITVSHQRTNQRCFKAFLKTWTAMTLHAESSHLTQRDESQTFFCPSVRFEPYYSAGPQQGFHPATTTAIQWVSIYQIKSSQMLEATVSANQAHCEVLYHTTKGKYKHFDPCEL